MSTIDPLYRSVASGVLRRASGTPGARTELAALRSGVGREPGSAIAAYSLVVADLDPVLLEGSHGYGPLERAAYTASTLSALHQQGRSAPVHVQGARLGRVVRASHGPGIARRFEAMLGTDSYPELVTHLRSIVTQARGQGLGLDYGRLAVDLWLWQSRTSRGHVRMTWARDRHTRPITQEN